MLSEREPRGATHFLKCAAPGLVTFFNFLAARKVRRGLHYLAGGLVAIIFVLPLYLACVASLRQPGLPPATSIEWWPSDPHWENYVTLFEILPMNRYILNSLIVVIVAVPLTCLIASLAGFAMSQQRDRWRRRLFVGNIALLMIPGMAVWMFRYQILQWLNLFDSLWSLIAPAFAGSNPLFVLLFYWTFRRVPAEIYEAARLDGAGVFTVWWQLARPLARPTAAGVAALTFVMYWSDFISPVLYVYRPQIYTLPVGLQILKQLDAVNWPLLMAAAVLMTIPVIIVFVWLQRFLLDEASIGKILDRNG